MYWRLRGGHIFAFVVTTVALLGASIFVSGLQPTSLAYCNGSDAPADYTRNDGCDTIKNGCPGANSSIPNPKNADLNCAFKTSSGSYWNCPVSTSKRCIFADGSTVRGTGSGDAYQASVAPSASGTACMGAKDVPNGTNCASIPIGCPGSTQVGPVATTGTVTCPYDAAANSTWSCRFASCTLPSGTVATNQNGANTVPPAPGGTTTDAAEPDLCDFGGNPMTWFICPILDSAVAAIGAVDSFISGSLTFGTTGVFENDSGFYAAWNSFRIIATALLVMAGLAIVISQALGFEFLDAYTLRKSLPRLLVAVVGISLSWYLMKYAIQFINVFGHDIRDIIYGPFQSLNQGFGGVNGQATGTPLGGGALFLTNGLFFGALVFMGPIAMLSFVGTALLAILVGFLIILVRNIAITLLIIIAPVAIVCYILPNTEKVWKLWYTNFIGLLLVFPIIMALIAAGHVFSLIALTGGTADATDGVEGSVSQVIGIVAYFIPYFILPLAFRFATGLIGNIAGFVNDKNRGAFDGLKKYRGNKMAQNTAALKAGNRYSDRNALTRGINKTGIGVGVGAKGRFGIGRKGAEAMDQTRRAAAEANVMKSVGWGAIQHDDDALKAATYRSESAAIAGLQAKGMSSDDARRAAAAARVSIGYGQPQAIAATQQLAATGTGYKAFTAADGTQVTALQDMAQTIARASGGNASTLGSLAGNMNSTVKKTGRMDLAPGAGTLQSLATSELGIQQSGRESRSIDQITKTYRDATRSAWDAPSLGQLVQGKDSTQTKHFADHFTQKLLNGTVSERKDAAIALSEMHSALPQASGGNQKIINQVMKDTGVTHDDMAYRQQMVADPTNKFTNVNQVPGRTIEQQYSDILRDRYAISMSPEAIRGQERAYNNSTPRGAMGGGDGAGGPAAPPGGTP